MGGDQHPATRAWQPAPGREPLSPRAAAPEEREAICDIIGALPITDADGLLFIPEADMDAAADRILALRPTGIDGWEPIETAPYSEEVEVRAGGMTFLAMLVPNGSMSDLHTSCDQWQAARDGEHPPCWSGGCCWASNEDEVMSVQPQAWRRRPLPVPPLRAGGEG